MMTRSWGLQKGWIRWWRSFSRIKTRYGRWWISGKWTRTWACSQRPRMFVLTRYESCGDYVDLRRAYLQVRVHESLLPFQTVIFRGQRYCLKRFGFGLNVMPTVMKSVLTAVLTLDETVDRATSSYIDDISINKDVVSVQCVENHLLRYGLECKPVERVADGAGVLGLDVLQGARRATLECNITFGDVPDTLTRLSVFLFCGKLIGHLQRRSWNWEPICRPTRGMRRSTTSRCVQCRKIRFEEWNRMIQQKVDGMTLGFVIELDGHVVEDANWLRSEDAYSHINMDELDALVKGVNAALARKLKKLHVRTGYLTVYHWILNAFSGKVRLKIKAFGEMLIRRRVDTIKALVGEWYCPGHRTWSESNRADTLTRVSEMAWEAKRVGEADLCCVWRCHWISVWWQDCQNSQGTRAPWH